MKIILFITISFLRILTFLLKITKKGRGTALPGLVIEKYFPFLVPHILRLSPYTVLITGTNGKTSTRTILTKILEDDGKQIIQNKSGSNLIRGILSEMVAQMDFFGKIKADYAIFEVEEATMPKMCLYIQPEQIIVTNIFRDQLDAYGEIDRTQKFIQEAINLSPKALVLFNGDDPRLKSLDSNSKLSYGLEKNFKSQFSYEGELEAKSSDQIATNIKVMKNLGTNFEFLGENFELNLPGLFQVYNALGAILCAKELKVKIGNIKNSLTQVEPAFGRGEIISRNKAKYQLFLIKNPAGANTTLEMLKEVDSFNLILVLNDKIADGRDVSWIWDANFEKLAEMKIQKIYCSGSRAEDMFLRIKHALGGSNKTEVKLEKNLKDLIKHEGEFIVLPTYTAMLSLRKLLTGNSLNV